VAAEVVLEVGKAGDVVEEEGESELRIYDLTT
jgi:hypothetical protein